MIKQDNSFKVGMTAFGAIFFIFGFATTFIVTLSAPVKAIFGLSETAAQLLSSSFFIAYLVFSIPAGNLIKRIGYKRMVIFGLLLMALGSLLFLPAAKMHIFPVFLIATFILATGVVFLQVSANPYVAALGPDSSASSRLNLTQALNSIATMVAPWIIAIAIYKGLNLPANPDDITAEMGLLAAARVSFPFIIMAIIVVLVAIVLMIIKLPEIEQKKVVEAKKSIWKYPHVILGALAIFFYVGAEVGNAGLLINYLKQIEIDGIKLDYETASKYAAIYWGGAMVGRFFGSFMFSDISMSKKITYALPVLILALVSGSFVTGWDWNIGGIFLGIAVVNFIIMQIGTGRAARTLAVFALVAASLDLITSFGTGQIALWTVISIGLFNSIMFPNIFALAVKGLDSGELSSASGLINTLIFGGAIIPIAMGSVAENFGYTWAFLVPALCYLYIVFYAVKGSQIRRDAV
ncbi:MAG: sugar MFS transporter [Lentimicrobium sp.]|nr:sugar MFS transporter [Lentimicrobium sp.]